MRVLVVEDEERPAAGLRTGLEAEGFAVDEAVLKREVLDRVWDDELESDPNIVEVSIRRLRSKDRPPLQPPGHRDAARRRPPG